MDVMCSVWQSNFKQWNKTDALVIPFKVALSKYLNAFALPLCVDNFWPYLNLNMHNIFLSSFSNY